MFEYRIVRADGFVSVEELNKLGADGWELVVLAPDEEGYDYIFKRFIKPHPSIMQQMKPVSSTIPTAPPPSYAQLMEVFKNVP